MGVKHFFPWLKQNHANDIRTINILTEDVNIDVDTLAIDMNGIIHNVSQKVYEYGAYKKNRMIKKRYRNNSNLDHLVYKGIGNSISTLVSKIKPKKRLLLCIDGVAGISKMSQQRQRRFKGVKERDENSTFDSNCITPGTVFMDRLSKYLDWFLRSQISIDPSWKQLNVIFSNEKVPGEGEHKIVRYLRSKRDEGESCCIHGMDADLVMLSLASPCKNIYIYREDSFKRDTVHILNIANIRQEMCNRILPKDEENPNKMDQKAINDFILLCYFVGNDFLPQLPGVEILQGGINTMQEIYREMLEDEIGRLSYSYKGVLRLKKKTFTYFLKDFAQTEIDLINSKIQKSVSFFKDDILDSSTTYDDQNNKVVDIQKYKEKFYNSHFPSDVSIKEICHEYLKGMQWILNYYTTGIPTWTWCYKVLPFEQLLSVLPPESINLLPPAFKNIMDRDGPLGKFFPEDIQVDLSGKRKEWEGIILLPKVDIDIFKKEYLKASKALRDPEKKRNIVGYTFSYTYSDNAPEFYSKIGDYGRNRCLKNVFGLDNDYHPRKREHNSKQHKTKKIEKEDILPIIPRKKIQ